MVLEIRSESFKHPGDGHSNLPDYRLGRELVPIPLLFKLV